MLKMILDKIKEIVLDKLKNLDLDKDGMLDTKQLEAFVERLHSLSVKITESIHGPTLEEAIGHLKVAYEALQRAIDVPAMESTVADAKVLFKDMVAYGQKAIANLKAGK